jgi:hypothetical protein
MNAMSNAQKMTVFLSNVTSYSLRVDIWPKAPAICGNRIRSVGIYRK